MSPCSRRIFSGMLRVTFSQGRKRTFIYKVSWVKDYYGCIQTKQPRLKIILSQDVKKIIIPLTSKASVRRHADIF